MNSRKEIAELLFNEFTVFLENSKLLSRKYDNEVKNDFDEVSLLFKKKICRCEVGRFTILPSQVQKMCALFDLISNRIKQCLTRGKSYLRSKEHIIEPLLEQVNDPSLEESTILNLLSAIYDAFCAEFNDKSFQDNDYFRKCTQIINKILYENDLFYSKEISSTLIRICFNTFKDGLLIRNNSKKYFVEIAIEQLLQNRVISQMFVWNVIKNIAYKCVDFLVKNEYILFKNGCSFSSRRSIEKGFLEFKEEMKILIKSLNLKCKEDIILYVEKVIEELWVAIESDAINGEGSIESAIKYIVQKVYNNINYYDPNLNREENSQLSQDSQEQEDQKEQDIIKKYNIPEQMAIIDRSILKNVIDIIKKRYSECNFNIKSLSKEVGANLSNAYSKGSSISLIALEKLENLSNLKISHTIVIDNKSTKRIILDKSKELAELIGFVLVSGNINIYTSKNSKSKVYSLYIHFRKRNRFELLINHLKSLIINLFNINESKIEIVKNKDNEIVAFRIYSLPIFYELFVNGVKIDDKNVPDWIFERQEFIVYCLKGLFNGYGDFSLNSPEYKNSVYGNFSLIFEKASPSSVDIAKNFKELCNKLKIETSKIYKRKVSNEDPNIRVIVRINKKDSYIKFLDMINPLIWDLKKAYVYEYFLELGIDPDSVFNYSENYLLEKKIKEESIQSFEEDLLHSFERYGNYDLVYEDYNRSFNKNKRKPLGKDRIIEIVKELFAQSDYLDAYGEDGYEKWYNNNSRILISNNIESIIFPYHLNIQIYEKIFQILNDNLFEIENSEVVKQTIDYFLNKKMNKISNVREPSLLEYGRLAFLLKDSKMLLLLKKYFEYIIKFMRKIQLNTEKGIRISYIRLVKDFPFLFYHHQQVKQIIEDLEKLFSKRFKVGYDQKYRWYRLTFKWHQHNFMKIFDRELFKKLSIHFDKVSKMEFDKDIFRVENPRCSDFSISGSRENPIRENVLLPYIDLLHKNGVIKINNESLLGKKLINYTNLAEQHYKKRFPQMLWNKFLSDEDNIYHYQLQDYIFSNDQDILGTEVFVWLSVNFPQECIDYLSGHIDFLFFYNNCIYICDYKPEARDRIFLKSIPQIATYGLILGDLLKVANIKIKCITFNKIEAWEYEPSILYTLIKEIVRELKVDYPIDAKWETYLSQYYNFSY